MSFRRFSLRTLAGVAFLGFAGAVAASAPEYALRNGDRVVFYGDSITDYGAYPYLIELFTATRYPEMKVAFSNAGVGGERVTGGGLGNVDRRLSRDLFARRPTVVTCMLGMNDGEYRPFAQDVFETYRRGYGHIEDRLAREAPTARVWLFRPTPYDDVTKSPAFPGGYNGVLKQFGEAVAELARARGYGLVDLNSPLVSLLERAKADREELANNLIPDRIHPIPQTHLAMAQEILKAWNALPIVSSTSIDWNTGRSTTESSAVKGWKEGSFDLLEKALPMPLERGDAFAALVAKAIDFDGTLNRQILQVTGMASGRYTLKIDGTGVGEFSDTEFSKGVNLAALDTPMVRQAKRVADLTGRLVGLRSTRWRAIELPMASAPDKERNDVVRSIVRLEEALTRERQKLARPVSHRFQIVRVP